MALLIDPLCAGRVPDGSIALATVASATPPDWGVSIHDENLSPGPAAIGRLPDVVGITVVTAAAARAYELARWHRARGSKVVLGGWHVQACPDEAARHADAIAVGEGVHAWPRILADVRAGRLQRVYPGAYRIELGREPLPRCLDADGTMALFATRGGLSPFQARRPEQVAAAIEAAGPRRVVFLDPDLASHRGYLLRLCWELRPLGMPWSAAVSLAVADDRLLLREMAGAGCAEVYVGIDSPADGERVARIRELDIGVHGGFVLGRDDHGPGVLARTLEWATSAPFTRATFRLLTPFPGTRLFRRLQIEGRILHRDWSRYDGSHVVFRPRLLTPNQLSALRAG